MNVPCILKISLMKDENEVALSFWSIKVLVFLAVMKPFSGNLKVTPWQTFGDSYGKEVLISNPKQNVHGRGTQKPSEKKHSERAC